jgi:hypothetical protein
MQHTRNWRLTSGRLSVLEVSGNVVIEVVLVVETSATMRTLKARRLYVTSAEVRLGRFQSLVSSVTSNAEEISTRESIDELKEEGTSNNETVQDDLGC